MELCEFSDVLVFVDPIVLEVEPGARSMAPAASPTASMTAMTTPIITLLFGIVFSLG